MRRFLLPLLLVAALATTALGPTVVAGAATDELSSLVITGDVGQKPTVAVTEPLAVKKTTAEVVSPGTGGKAAKGAKVTFNYVIVNGRTGAELETSFGRTPVSIVLDKSQAQPVIVDGLVGTPVGSRVVIAIAPKEGFAKSAQSDAVKKSDTLLFVVDLADATVPLARAEGEAVAPPGGLPSVKLGKDGKPTVTIPKGDAPTELVVQPLIKGSGAAVRDSGAFTVHYTGVNWRTGKVFDSSWKRGSPDDFQIGGGAVAGWDEGLLGQTVGSQVLIVIPPDKGFGSQGVPEIGVKGTDTIVFVVDILAAT